MIEGLRAQAEAKRQTLEVDLPSELPEVAMDARRIGQVISNLVRMRSSSHLARARIRISARQQEQKIVVSVADTGPGIPQEHLLRIFDRFWQAPETKELGSGLGLSIVKGIVEAS
jgi:histidine kinase